MMTAHGEADRVDETAERTGLEVAIIGMAGRFPGARNLEELWRNLRDGVESIAFFDEDALLRAGADPELVAQPGFVGVRSGVPLRSSLVKIVIRRPSPGSK